MKIPFKRGNILLPKNTDMTKWSVVACDQYTSEPEYWNSVREIVGSNPSTLNLTLPEIYLEESDVEERIKKINQNMEELVNMDFFNEYSDSMIYLERTQEDGKVREGLMGIVDLEDYSYEKGSQTLIRATEKTVIERIPPRVKVRELQDLIKNNNRKKNNVLNEAISLDNDSLGFYNILSTSGNIIDKVINSETDKEIKEYLTIEEIKVYELKKEGRSNSDISKILDKPYKNITNTISRIKCKLISLD